MHTQKHSLWAIVVGVLTAVLPLAIFLLPNVVFAQFSAGVDCPSPCFDGGGLLAGINFASGIIGILKGDPAVTINLILFRILSFLALLAVVAITVAGLYLILGFGDETAKDRAKRIILYTIIGLAIILLASVIVNFVFFMFGVGGFDAEPTIRIILNRILSYLALIAVIAIIVAGFYLILGFGDETARDKAKKIIIYTIVGLIIILLATVIVDFVFFLFGDGSTGIRGRDIRPTIVEILIRVLNYLALLAVIAIVAAGFLLILDFGNDTLKDRAKKIIIYTIIGLIVILLARVIVAFFLGFGEVI